MRQQTLSFVKSAKRKSDPPVEGQQKNKKQKKEPQKPKEKPSNKTKEIENEAENPVQEEGVRFSNSMKDAVKTLCKICRFCF